MGGRHTRENSDFFFRALCGLSKLHGAGADMAPVKLLRVGDLVEALDLEGQWYPARVMQQASEGLSVLLHFDGWSDSYDEWLPQARTRTRS